jgi:hypothetical protein
MTGRAVFAALNRLSWLVCDDPMLAGVVNNQNGVAVCVVPLLVMQQGGSRGDNERHHEQACKAASQPSGRTQNRHEPSQGIHPVWNRQVGSA